MRHSCLARIALGFIGDFASPSLDAPALIQQFTVLGYSKQDQDLKQKIDGEYFLQTQSKVYQASAVFILSVALAWLDQISILLIF